MDFTLRGIEVIRLKDMENKYIVLGGDNLNTLGIIRSLGEVDISPIVILYSEGHIKLVPHSKYVKHLFWVNSIEEGLSLMYNYTSEAQRAVVFITDDNTENYFDLHFDDLIKDFYFYNAGVAGRITNLMDKKVICDLAEECGFTVPTGEVVFRGELPHVVHYPVITKTLNPYSPGWKRDVGIYHSVEELAEGYKGMISEKILLQEYVQKSSEMQIRGISYDDGKIVLIPYYSIVERCTDTSFGGYYHYHQLNDENLKEKVCRLLSSIRYNGIFAIDFLVDTQNVPVFLEVNFRSGAYDYADTFGGVNHPYIWSQLVLGNPITSYNLLPRFSAIDEFSDFITSVLIHKVSFFNWLKELFCADCHFYYNAKDPVPFFLFILSKVLRRIKKPI